ncbi:type IV inositol polyphosphate 5-phosphatase 7-like [Macadamia integrifolia]|uniref:type IV inositol polyphosphate 5-phosphatase 7-like n=1 Tax=Macadamia integrifolia TaxID=60698 RepID=UPI001C500861|nr:type IV inositol polyphosphate 5-phosphatase 7-like [Macadamia integrifolia]
MAHLLSIPHPFAEGGGDEEPRSSFSGREAYMIKKSKTERLIKDCDRDLCSDMECGWKITTWSLESQRLASHLTSSRYLHSCVCPIINFIFLYNFLLFCSYANTRRLMESVFIPFSKFQEIVPLNAGNVLGAKDNGPARKWLARTRKTLNNIPGTSGSARKLLHAFSNS